MIFSYQLIVTAILGILIFFVTYRLLMKPFQVLQDDIDRVLKGDMNQVTHEFKIQELNPLWDVVNSSLQRIPKSADGMDFGQSDSQPVIQPEEYVNPLRIWASATGAGFVLFDAQRRIVSVNEAFQDLSGIRETEAIGQEMASVARDQALPALCNDLIDRALPGAEAYSEDFEFSGITYEVRVVAFGPSGESARVFALVAVRKGGLG